MTNLNLDNRIAEDEKNTKLILQKNDKDKKREAKASETNELETVSDDRTNNFLTMESLILAQDERWRRASYMQVEREAGACSCGKWRTGE